MPSFTEAWDETKPAGSRDLSLGDDDMREFKRAQRERDNVDHHRPEDETDNENVGYHRQVTLPNGSTPAAVDGSGRVFAKTTSGRVELFYIDDAGQEIQLTVNGRIRDSVLAQSGDWMLSTANTSRTGWTNVSATYEDKFIRINATALSTGGSDTHAHTEVGGLTAAGTSGVNSPTHDSNVADAGAPGFKAFGLGQTTHTHVLSGIAVTGTTASGANVPAFVTVNIFQKD